MRPHARLLTPALAFSLLASAAFAAPALPPPPPGFVHLNWDRCIADGRVANKNFACDTNSGTETLAISFESSVALTNQSGVEVVIEIVSADPGLPAWWGLKNVGACRQSALSFLATDPLAGACDHPFQTTGVGGVGAYTLSKWGANNAELQLAVAVPPSNLFSVGPGIETFCGRLILSHVKTVGAGACAGCDRPVCIAVGSIRVTSPTGNVLMQAFGPNPGGGPGSVTWQGAHVADYNYNHSDQEPQFSTFTMTCEASIATASRRSTWGGIKSHYR